MVWLTLWRPNVELNYNDFLVPGSPARPQPLFFWGTFLLSSRLTWKKMQWILAKPNFRLLWVGQILVFIETGLSCFKHGWQQFGDYFVGSWNWCWLAGYMHSSKIPTLRFSSVYFLLLIQQLVVKAVSLAIARDGASGGVVRTVVVRFTSSLGLSTYCSPCLHHHILIIFLGLYFLDQLRGSDQELLPRRQAPIVARRTWTTELPVGYMGRCFCL